jgi:lipopolysaccharide export system permease protein
MEKFADSKLVEKLTADNVRWDPEKKKWVINNYWVRKIEGEREIFESGFYKDTTLNMLPEDYLVIQKQMETYSTPKLKKEIAKMKMRGVKTTEWEIERHKRVSRPFSMFILTFIGAGLASRKIKGGLGLHLGFGILLSFSYIMFMQVSTVFAISGATSPILAVWIPNILFTVIALFIFRWAAR